MRFWVVIMGLAATLASWQAASAGTCAPPDADPAAAVQKLYAAVNLGDAGSVSRLFAPGFYAFDHGERMTGRDLAAQVEGIAIHRPPYIWTVEGIDAHLACDTAWVSYTNRHVPKPGANVPLKAYLESVVLIWLNGEWKIRFFHSTPVPGQ